MKYKTDPVQFRLPARDKARILAAAEIEGKLTAAWVRDVVMQAVARQERRNAKRAA